MGVLFWQSLRCNQHWKTTFIFEKYLHPSANLQQGMPCIEIWVDIFHLVLLCFVLWAAANVQQTCLVFQFKHDRARDVSLEDKQPDLSWIFSSFTSFISIKSLHRNAPADSQFSPKLPCCLLNYQRNAFRGFFFRGSPSFCGGPHGIFHRNSEGMTCQELLKALWRRQPVSEVFHVDHLEIKI